MPPQGEEVLDITVNYLVRPPVINDFCISDSDDSEKKENFQIMM